MYNENNGGNSTNDDVINDAGSSNQHNISNINSQIIKMQEQTTKSQPNISSTSSFNTNINGMTSDKNEKKINYNKSADFVEENISVPKNDQASTSSNKYQKLSVKILDKTDTHQAFILPKKSGYRHKHQIVPVKDNIKHLQRPVILDQGLNASGIIVTRPMKKVKTNKSDVTNDKQLANSVKVCDEKKTGGETGQQEEFTPVHQNKTEQRNEFQSANPIMAHGANHFDVPDASAIRENATSHNSKLKSLLSNAKRDHDTHLNNLKSIYTGENNKCITNVTGGEIGSASTDRKVKNEATLTAEQSRPNSVIPPYTPDANEKVQTKCLLYEKQHDAGQNVSVSGKSRKHGVKKCNIISIVSNVEQSLSHQIKENGQNNKCKDVINQSKELNTLRVCETMESGSSNMNDNKDASTSHMDTLDDNPDVTLLKMSIKKKKKFTKKNPAKLENQDEDLLEIDKKKESKKRKAVNNTKGTNAKHTRTPCPKASKTGYDFGSRYKIDVDKGKDIYSEDYNVINQVESDKLSSVKDHRLLTLSDDEKAFLRSKFYLSSDATTDVRRRFEPKKSTKPEVKCHVTENTSIDTIFNTEQSTNLKEMTTSRSFSQQNAKPLTAKQVGVLNSPRQVNNRSEMKGERKDSPSPIVKLKRIDDMIQFPSTSGTVVKLSLHPDKTTTVTQNDQTNTLNNKKVYYVINKDELNRLSAREPSSTAAADINPQKSVTIPTDSNVKNSVDEVIENKINNKAPSEISQSQGTSSNKIKVMTPVKQTTNQLNVGNRSIANVINSTQRIVVTNGPQRREDLKVLPANRKSLTVKELLEVKRTSPGAMPVTYVQTLSSSTPAVQALDVPLVLNGTIKPGTYGNFIYANKGALSSPVSNGQTLLDQQSKMPFPKVISTQSSSRSQSTSSNIQYIEQGLRIISPTNLVSLAPFVNVSRGTVYPAYVNLAKNTTTNRLNVATATPYERHMDKPMHIKIGETTMIVRNRPKSDSSNRKTLPAPKTKHKISDDYKKSRKRLSKKRKLELASQRCLHSKLRTLLLKSQDSLHKLAETLDLVPVDILKRVLTAPTHESETIRGENAIEHFDDSFTQVVANSSVNKGICEENSMKKLCSRVNIMQIYKNEIGICSYNKHQVLIKYRTHNIPAEDHNSQLEFPCRVRFDKDRNVSRISTETFHQGLYLINEIPIDMELMRSEKVLKTTMTVRPPHTDVLPASSLSIAIGEILSTSHNDRLTLNTLEDNNVQKELNQFLKPFAMDHIADIMDKRYCSETNRSLSPRSYSPMFYTEKMADKFDHYGNVVDSDSSSEDLTIENRNKLDSNLVRFSERAMALKVKQNELFESCRKLKSHENARMEPKKKRRKIAKEVDNYSMKLSDEIVEEIVPLSEGIGDQQPARGDDNDTEQGGDPELQDVDIE